MTPTMTSTDRKVTFPDGRSVRPIGLGTWNLGSYPPLREQAVAALRRGIDMGADLVDTAEMYRNEDLVGKAIEGRRENIYLVGKVLPTNASFKGAIEACERSLRKLMTDRFDLYLLHWSGPFPIDETVGAMLELQRRGLILSWGVSNMDVAEMDDFYATAGGPTCATDQVLYNLAYRGIEYDLKPWLTAHGMPLMAYSPILQGRLAESPDEVVESIAREHGATAAQIALAWAIRDGHTIAIPKSGTPAHAEENMRALEIELSAEDLDRLDAAFPPPTKKTPLFTI